MKKKIYIYGVTVLFIIFIVFANFIYNTFHIGEIENPKINRVKNVKTWKEPNMEYLKYYDLGAFDTNLPVIHIDTMDQRIVKEAKIWAKIAVINQIPDGIMRNIYDTPDYEAAITINLRGASSYALFDKEQYRIKFYKKQGQSGAKDYDFLGMGANSEWVLHGPFLDKTLLRNKVIYEISREIFNWAPDTRFCEVFVNGKYMGVYLGIEPVTNGETRLRLSKFGLSSGRTSYIVQRNREGSEENPLRNYGKITGKTSNDLYIDYPSKLRITKIQRQWIENDISKFEKVLYSKDFDDPKIGYSKYIDVNEFVDYFILNEVVMNNDAGNLSTYIYKKLEGKIQIAPWDFNNVYNNYQWFRQDYSKFFMKDAAWFQRLLQDRHFVDLVVERYWDLREDLLSTENFHRLIKQGTEELGEAIERNFAVWGYTFHQDLMVLQEGINPNPHSYEDALNKLKSSIAMRFEFLDNHITDLYNGTIN